ncbi:MAG: hypothetical protein ACKKL4_01260 [Patescibacteria group bacterium]
MKNLVNMKCMGRLGHTIKYIFMALIGLSIIYSFGVTPLNRALATKACHTEALATAQNAAAQAQEANKNLEEGQPPIQIDQIAVYNTQYTLCTRSRGI